MSGGIWEWRALGVEGSGCGCGKANINPYRIAGGHDALENEYPWMLYLIVSLNFSRIYCGASLIAPSWAMTSAFCVDYDYNKLSIVYGMHKFADNNDNNTVEVDQVIVHPNNNADKLEYDVVLLHLKTPVPLSDEVLPVCLATTPPRLGTTAVVSGWGVFNEDGDIPAVLQEAPLKIKSNKRCQKAYDNIGFTVPDSVICAAKKDIDVCAGDNGGPMVIETSKNVWTQVGIVSFGFGCPNKDYLGVYSRVDSIFDWIVSIVNEFHRGSHSFITEVYAKATNLGFGLNGARK
ncbi:chymotrypsin A-like [Oratosquilla oratoria]|uniref:chymotrypsin A-like n=1 Tax=Oratosquilla oratoria TaxID=337810 RepID=UPI003F765231